MAHRTISKTAKRVEECRSRRGWSQAELARQVTMYREPLGKAKVKQQSINQLELGEVNTPRYIFDLANVLEVSISWLLGDDDVAQVPESVVRVPLISWVQAGELAEAADPYIPGDAEDFVPISYRHSNLIALRVKGDSMNRVSPDSSIIIVDLNDRDLVDGKHYIFRNEGHATFKTYRAGPPTRLAPHSYDDGYRDIIPEDGIEVVGRVIRKTEDI